MLHVQSVKYYKDYKLQIQFNDGETHIIDFEKTIFSDTRQIVSDLKDINLFKSFSIKYHTIVWKNGLDFAPEFIKNCSIKLVQKSA